ncbi:hypothetical protein [Thermoflexus sp.]|uniref:hypothetical protein n=1 Tax=Thermoflexus sp. TaxID=1969742 RepID=UPI0035E3F4AA
MEIEIERSWIARVLAALAALLLLAPMGVGLVVTPYDASGRAILLSRDLLEARAFLEEARRVQLALSELDREMEALASAPALLPTPHPGAPAAAAPPVARPMTLLERTREASRILRRLQELAVGFEGRPAPAGLEPARERARAALQAFARRGTALADYLAVPTPEGWERLRAEAEASRKALRDLEEALR